MPLIPEFVRGQRIEKGFVTIEFPEEKIQFDIKNVMGNIGSKVVSELIIEPGEDFLSFVDRARGNDGSKNALELTLQSYEEILLFLENDGNVYITENGLWLFTKSDEIDFPKLGRKEDNS